MKLRFVAQPFVDQPNLLEFLSDALPQVSTLSIAVAWAKRSGLARIAPTLSEFRTSGGSALLVVGIDEGGATKQGLSLAMDLFDSVYILHDNTGRTFHPKLYLAEGADRAFLFSGSNNLTAGGLFFNYEWGLSIELDLTLGDDARIRDEARAYFDRLTSDAGLCVVLDAATYETLTREKRYRIEDEDARHRSRAANARDSDSRVEIWRDRLFGASKIPKKTVLAGLPTVAPEVGVAWPLIAAGSASSSARVVRRWVKQLTYSDAQQPPRAGSNPTGNMRLTKAGHPIDQKTYFFDTFFRDANWKVRSGTLMFAQLTFRTTIDGKSFGQVELMLDHDPRRIAGQNNAPTFLHWGDVLGQELRQTNYAGCYLALELLDSGDYTLVVSPTYPGDFADTEAS